MQAMQNFTQEYSYDRIENILQMKSLNNWTRDYQYPTVNNLLIGHTEGQTEYTYDGHGNTSSMPHLQLMKWDFADKLREVELDAAGNVAYYNYDFTGNRVRKVIDKGNIKWQGHSLIKFMRIN